MRILKAIAAAATLSLLLYSCNSARRAPAGSSSEGGAPATSSATTLKAATDATSTTDGSTDSITNPARKIIRTADLRCRVKDVYTATTRLEIAVKAAGGLVADSRMNNEATESRTLPYSADSLRRLQVYTTTAHLALRIPFQKIDSLLAEVAGESAFINSRHIQLSDVSLQYLGNELKNRAAQGYTKPARPTAYADDRDDAGIDRRIENLNLLDNVRYATLSIDLYQPERLDAVIIANTDALMKPGIGQRTLSALSGGWDLLQNCALLLLNIWPLLIIAAVVLVIMRRRKARRTTIARA